MDFYSSLCLKNSVTLLLLAHFGHRIAPGLPGDAGLRLYSVTERGGMLRTDRAVTTCRHPHYRRLRGKRR
jgi:hypothetical protein